MKALITGITGQVGSYLAESLLEQGYIVHGLDRRKSVPNYKNIEHIKDRIKLIEGDLTDPFSVNKIVEEGQYDEIYNLAAQSHVHTSFEQPRLTLEVNTLGVLNLLEAIRNKSPKTRMYQASTSEMFGNSEPPQSESTRFYPRSPYGVSKLAAHWLVQNYRESYDLKVACGIMFNTESPRRGDNFVTKKIINWVKAYQNPLTRTMEPLELGNLDARRDWSHCLDSVDAIYRICNQNVFKKNWDSRPYYESYTFGSGVACTIREFLVKSLTFAFGDPDRFEFRGEGLDEHVYDRRIDHIVVRINPKFYRPSEVDFLQCKATKIKDELGWEPKYDLDTLILDMLQK